MSGPRRARRLRGDIPEIELEDEDGWDIGVRRSRRRDEGKLGMSDDEKAEAEEEKEGDGSEGQEGDYEESEEADEQNEERKGS